MSDSAASSHEKLSGGCTPMCILMAAATRQCFTIVRFPSYFTALSIRFTGPENPTCVSYLKICIHIKYPPTGCGGKPLGGSIVASLPGQGPCVCQSPLPQSRTLLEILFCIICVSRHGFQLAVSTRSRIPFIVI